MCRVGKVLETCCFIAINIKYVRTFNQSSKGIFDVGIVKKILMIKYGVYGAKAMN